MTPALRHRFSRLTRRTGGPLLAAALLASLSGCAKVTAYRASADRDSLGVPPVAIRLPAKRKTVTPTPLPAPPFPMTVPDKIHPLVRQAMQDTTREETLLVTFRDPLAPRSAEDINFTVSAAKDSLGKVLAPNSTDAFVRARKASYDTLTVLMSQRYGAVELKRYWMTHALLVRMSLRFVDDLANDPEVRSISPLRGQLAPPQLTPCGTKSFNLRWLRDAINSEPYVTAGNGDGRIALLDTGVESNHPVLGTGPGNPLESMADCNGALGDCGPMNPQDDAAAAPGHGTQSAGILAATAVKGDADRGITRARLSSYKVYDAPAGGVHFAGAKSAYEDAMANTAGKTRHDVVLADVADGYGKFGDLTDGANWCYDLGAVVIAAGGNDFNSGIPQPANSTRALAVGMHCASTLGTLHIPSAFGTTPDLRIKPDLCAPTGIWTAAKGAQDMWVYDGTSCSAPVVAAVARILRNRMTKPSRPVKPGAVYAMLLACGGDGSINSQGGVGLIKLPTGGHIYWGSIPVKAGTARPIELPATWTVSGMEAAIWWAEYGTSNNGFPSLGERAWVGLDGIGPNTGPIKSSADPWSSFQRISVGVPAAQQPAASTGANTGNGVTKWSITINGKWVPEDEEREVFYAIWAKP